MATELKRLKAEGKAEAVERVSGVFHRAGYRAEVRARRSGLLAAAYYIVARRSQEEE